MARTGSHPDDCCHLTLIWAQRCSCCHRSPGAVLTVTPDMFASVWAFCLQIRSIRHSVNTGSAQTLLSTARHTTDVAWVPVSRVQQLLGCEAGLICHTELRVTTEYEVGNVSLATAQTRLPGWCGWGEAAGEMWEVGWRNQFGHLLNWCRPGSLVWWRC